MESKEISALPLALADKKAQDLSEGELGEMELEMHQIEQVGMFLDFEWGYRFYIGCLKDTEGIKNYRKLGWDTEDEWIKSFRTIKRRTAFNRKKVYKLWALYLYDLPTNAFFGVHTSNLLTIQNEIVNNANDKEKLMELLNEASALSRTQLEQKYRKSEPTMRGTGKLTKLKSDLVGRTIQITQGKLYWTNASNQNLWEIFGNQDVDFIIKLKKRIK